MSARVPRPPRRPGPWFLITGLILGILAGLAYAWYFDPVQYGGASPASLRAADQDQYRLVVALAYRADGDRWRAEARLKQLGDTSPADVLAAQAQQALAENGPSEDAQALAALAEALRQPAPPLPTAGPAEQAQAEVPTELPEASATLPATLPATATPRATYTPLPTLTPAPTQTPSPTPGAPFALVGQSPICDPKLARGLLQVVVENSAQQPVAGVRVAVSWKGGEDSFFTGLSGDNPGYADFVMAEGVKYAVRVGDSGEPVSDLTPQQCTQPDGSKYLGGIKLRFRQ